MAVVKILKKSSSFKAIEYNQNRSKLGQGILVTKGNFGLAEQLLKTPKDYMNYFTAWSKKNTRIKYPQFHATISVKGKSLNKEQLAEIGKQWLEKMGYVDTPYMIFFHGNTENNHIHIVTTRVDKNGHKINDSYEKYRSVKMLNEVMGESEFVKYRKDIRNLLSYSFSTPYQFIELCRESGFYVWKDEKEIKDEKGNPVLDKDNKPIKDFTLTIKKGSFRMVLKKDLIEWCAKRYNINNNPTRQKELEVMKKQIQAKIYKYAELLNKEDFVYYMRSKFGLAFKFYGEGSDIKGFTVIDFKNRTILKSKELFSVKKINELFSMPGKEIKYNLIVKDILQKDKYCTTENIQKELKHFDISISVDSFVDLKSRETIGKINPDLLERIQYNDKLHKVLKDYNPQTAAEKKCLSQLFGLKMKDMNIQVDNPRHLDERIISHYRDMIQDCLKNGEDLRRMLEEQGLMFYQQYDDFCIVDIDNSFVLSGQRMNVAYSDVMANNRQYSTNMEGDRFGDEYVGMEYDHSTSWYESLLNTPSTGLIGTIGGGKKKKKNLQ